MTGHKNVLRKVIPNQPWAGADGTFYPLTDDFYQSGSIFDWNTGTVMIGGPGGLDPANTYPYYFTHQNLYYVFGGWADRNKLNTIFDKGFTGAQYPNGNYSCARCHTTGYRFDGSGPEPTYSGTKIPDAQFRRVPSTFTSGTSSWQLDGIQCERCHVADNGVYNHTATARGYRGIPSVATNENATALCIECHRQETVDTNTKTIALSTELIVTDHGSCEDGTRDYAACVAAGRKWNYRPFFESAKGQTFLNSPHARFTGTLAQNAQNSSDLSVKVVGGYYSAFTDWVFLNRNGGCTGCHDPHTSMVTSPSTALWGKCGDCHNLDKYGPAALKHPKGSGPLPLPFPNLATDDVSAGCALCHMPNGYHVMRISTDPNYSTFPLPAQLHDPGNPQTKPNTASDGVIPNAVWIDLDIACGQCHLGSGNGGITPPPGIPVFTKGYLSGWAKGFHLDPVAPTPTFAPTSGTYTTPQTVTISDSAAGVTIYYTTDGSTPTTSSTAYTGPITVATTTTISAIAAGDVYRPSSVATRVYRIVATAPTFSPSPGTYTTPQLVTLADSTPGVTIYYTTDGSTPTTSSAPYSGPITISTSTTIKAIAAGNGYDPGSMATGVYNVVATPPTFSPRSGTYNAVQSVTLADSTPSVTIYYTSDGSTPTTSSTAYTAPISVATTTTIRAIAAGNGYGPSTIATGAYKIVAATPTFSPAQGTYVGPQSVTLASATPGATIYYTTDGSTPTTSSTVYGGPIPVSVTTTIKALADATGFETSSVATGIFTIKAAAPTFSPNPGTYTTSQSVTLASATAGASIYYTMDGSTPTTSSTVYTGPISVSTTTTIKAIAGGTGFSPSSVSSGVYTIQSPQTTTATPTFSPAAGTYNTFRSITLACATAGASIYYTTDGSTPTTSSTQYLGTPIPLTGPTATLKAIAVASGYAQSAVATAVYIFKVGTPSMSPPAATFTTPQSVTLATATTGAAIYFTTDGSTPTAGSTLYTGPIPVVGPTMTVKAIALADGYTASTVASGTYNLKAAMPSFSPTPSTYSTAQSVRLSTATPGATIYYTTDGTAPSTGSAAYTGPISVTATTTIRAIAVASGYSDSVEASGTFAIRAAVPSFTPAAGTYTGTQSVTLACTTPGAVIYYTTDGTTPTTSSTSYTEPISVAATTTIKAIAVAPGYAQSLAATGLYTIR